MRFNIRVLGGKGTEVVHVTKAGRSLAAMVALVALAACVVAPMASAEDNANRTLLMAEGLFRIAKVKMTQRQFPEAETNLRRLVALPFPAADPKAQSMLAASYVGLVDCLMRQAKLDDALRTGLEALKLPCFAKPSVFKSELYKMLGKAYEAKGAADKSVEYFEKAVQMLDALDAARKR